ANFVRLLDDEELTAALAHELAHVWIYTHHPFLHTEVLANQIAMQVVPRDSLNQLYFKVRTFYGDRGTIDVPLTTAVSFIRASDQANLGGGKHRRHPAAQVRDRHYNKP